MALLADVDTQSYIRTCSRSECQISEEGYTSRTRERSDDMDAVFIDGWVGRSTDRLIRGPSSPSWVLSVFWGLEK